MSEQARRRMIADQLQSRGIRDPLVLDAIERVPRERFVPAEHRHRAHEDRALPLTLSQTISQPYIVALMTQELKVRPTDRVLEIGTGSGYQTAILAHLAARVYTVERLAPLSDGARELLTELKLDNVCYRIGDGTLGWPDQAPFDRIIVTAGGPVIPEALLEQLRDPGRLVAPIGDRDVQRLYAVERHGDALARSKLCRCSFVPLLGAQGWSDTA